MLKLSRYWVAILASLLLLGALTVDLLWELRPCKLCWVQRCVLVVLVLMDVLGWRVLRLLCVVVGLVLSVYQLGVEQVWWKNSFCESSASVVNLHTLSIDEQMELMREQIVSSPIGACEHSIWRFLKISSTAMLVCVYIVVLGGVGYEYRCNAACRPRR